MLAILLLLVPAVLGSHDPEFDDFCQSLELKPSSGQRMFFCHPRLKRSFVECHTVESGGERHECPENQYFSQKRQACVSIEYSDCAAKFTTPTNKLLKKTCEKYSGNLLNIPTICHPSNHSAFIVCKPNTAMAEEFSCGDLAFSQSLSKCVPLEKSDCAKNMLDASLIPQTSDSPHAANMEMATTTVADAPAAANIEMGSTTVSPAAANMEMASTTVLPAAANMAMAFPTVIPAAANMEMSSTTVFPENQETATTTEKPDAANMHHLGHNHLGHNHLGYQQYTEFQPPVHQSSFIEPPKPFVPPVNPAKLPVPSVRCRSQYNMHPEKMDWFSANDVCLAEGGHLAVIRTESQQSLISSRYARNYDFWIGLNDIDREGEFRWVNGEGLGFANWADKNPSSVFPNDQDCVTYNFCNKQRTKCWRGLWGDWDCSVSKPFLCETKVCRNLG